MKILVIPDVHGSHEWEEAKKFSKNEYDYIVFLGDYFDSWENRWPDQGENFETICDFVREDIQHRKMLLGNHDWSYLSKTVHGAGVSGHQSNKASLIKKLLTNNLDIIDLAFECDGYIFSHAGFSKTWIQSVLKISCADNSEWSIDFINSLWHKISLNPNDGKFNYEFEELLDWHGFISASGNEVTQGPLWIRPESLLKDSYYKTQVVGHTELCYDEYITLFEKGKNEDETKQIILADSPTHKCLGILDTKNKEVL